MLCSGELFTVFEVGEIVTTGMPSNDGVDVESTKLAGRFGGDPWVGEEVALRKNTGDDRSCRRAALSIEDIT